MATKNQSILHIKPIRRTKGEVSRKSDMDTELLFFLRITGFATQFSESLMCSCINSPVPPPSVISPPTSLSLPLKDDTEETIPPRHLRHTCSAPPSQHPDSPPIGLKSRITRKQPHLGQYQANHWSPHITALFYLCQVSQYVTHPPANILRDLGVRGDRHYSLHVPEDFPTQTLFSGNGFGSAREKHFRTLLPWIGIPYPALPLR